ncbi:DNA replication regulator SLD3-domain-containing protein [Geopyxis carbonaria]|nr:DNA replication regulator SLD3-domain-containing protein [Geopyxis carbonaria]
MEIPASTSRKRKCVEPQNVDLNSFSIQSHLSSPFDPAVRITPTVVLPHNHVPLHWIAGVPSRFFDRSVEFTELVRPGDVAIVKIEGERQLSAIESLEDGVYALYRLSTQVKLKEVRKLNAQITRSRKDKECKTLDHTQQSADDPWWCSSGTHRYPFSDHENNGLIGTTSLDWGGGVVSYRLSTGDAALHGQHSLTARPSSFEVLDHLRHQYYQTLYLSKTSLAYFSKSALSRARTMFQGEQPCPPLNGLVDFLKTMIVPLQEMDTKYLKSLVHFASEETIDDNSVFRTHEDAYIPRWRSLAFGDRFIQENDTHLKEVLAALRTRESGQNFKSYCCWKY